ncbi:hypothetical protein TAMC210_26140 [Thermanaeromonas sp. C210]|nr:nickel-dependent lactate racemase [Thermanaeromonas sp. C210]GFN24296.1 hypothetical protein TAMC210_26140 [Thermanaeromonas sp. C210]
MDVHIAYGKGKMLLKIPSSNVTVIEPIDVPGVPDEEEALKTALEHPIGTPALRNIVKKGESVAIVISDKTRPTPSHKIVPVIIEILKQIPCGEIIIINGTGTHRANTPEELKEMLGSSIVDRFKVINHDCHDETQLTYLGTTKRNTPVWLNSTYVKAERKIVVGFIEPHFFAGFSGGPKGVVPGVAGIKTIMRLHRAAFIEDPHCTWGVLENNPVQEDVTEACLMAKPDFCINVSLNRQYAITGVFAGDVIKAHRQGCLRVRKASSWTPSLPASLSFATVRGTN